MASVDAANAENAVRLLRFLVLESDFTSALLHVARTDEREVHYLALGLSKQVLDALSASHNLCSSNLRPQFEKIAAALRDGLISAISQVLILFDVRCSM